MLVICWLWPAYWGYSQNYWSPFPEEDIPQSGPRYIVPNKYNTAVLDTTLLLAVLRQAPHENDVSPYDSPAILPVITPEGGLIHFRVVRYDMMEPGLAARYPGIMTFLGVSTGRNPYFIRFDWTARGFHAAFTSPRGKVFIDPYCFDNVLHYVSYYTSDYPAPAEPFVCHITKEQLNSDPQELGNGEEKAGDCVFRSYRLAVATTGEYSNYHGADDPSESALVLSAVVTAVNRVNQVYERDVTIRMILIANTDDVFYYNPGADPFTNNDGGTMLGENQANMDLVIGTANYDMGHVFSTGGGGVANLYSPCSPSLKARGVTGLGNPIGDPFYIDYVAHEMGHQFGAHHTQNNSCNRTDATAMEPGSASTIMGYAGICPPNIQNNSDDYFHAISVQEIGNFVAFSSGNNCDTPLPFINNPPSVSAGTDRSIPISTPFMLTAIASDPDSHPLNYCWEQWDNEVGAMPPQQTNAVGPMFRSFDPNNSPIRYFPRLQDLVNNLSPTWEVLPSVGRDMEFRVTVRDNNGAAGCTDEDNMVVTAVGGIGPFVVTAPNTVGVMWTEGQSVSVTWNVANTTSAPVSCSTVDIFLSYDGGFTYPVQLANNVTNNGSATVTVPAGTTTTARVMVKAEGNIFFDISNFNFSIIAGVVPDFTMGSTPIEQSVCPPNEAVFSINTSSLGGFSGNVTLSLTGAPAGTSHNFSPNTAPAGFTSTLTITNLTFASPGTYNMQVSGSGLPGTHTVDITLTVGLASGTPGLSSPSNGGSDITIVPVFIWGAASNATSYLFELSTSSSFSTLVSSVNTASTSLQPSFELQPLTTYYWRVRSSNATCTSNWSTTYSFSTVPCFTYISTDVPKTIPATGTPTITSTLNITDSGTLRDVNVVNLTGTHTWVSDLIINLISPLGTPVLLFNQLCTDNDNFNLNYNDQAASATIPCPPTEGGSYRPVGFLSTMNGQSMTGQWTLQIQDVFGEDGGDLQSWGIRVCPAGYSSPLPVEWLSFEATARENLSLISLEWATAAEFNNAGFHIERKAETESEFTPLEWVDTKGNGGVSQRYQWSDRTAQRGLRYYYRLRQLDYDGMESYSPLRTAILDGNDINCRLFWQAGQALLLLGCPFTTGPTATCSLYNMQGQQLLSEQVGVGMHTIPLDYLPQGIYLVVVQAGNEVFAQRIVR